VTVATTAPISPPALTDDFDYERVVFGDEGIVDLDSPTWGAIRMRRCLAALVDVRGHVLEVGCGAGRCIRTVHAHRPDLKAYGCDISETSLALADEHRDGIRYDFANAATLPYPADYFDALMVLDLIEHVPDVGGVLAEFRRVLKPGGRLFLHVPCEGEFLSLYLPLLACGIDLTHRAVGHLHHFSRIEVVRAVRRAGFEVRRRQYSMFPICQCHDMVNWIAMLSRQDGDGPSASPIETRPTDPAEISTALKWKRAITGPLWHFVSHSVPKMQYWETRLLSWQPIGGIGLCLTCDRADR
jgi:SAM-dependent methyltransferase